MSRHAPRVAVVAILAALTLACSAGGPKRPKAAPSSGRIVAERDPWCFTHSAMDLELRVEFTLGGEVSGGFARWTDPRQGRTEAQVTGGAHRGDQVDITVQAPKARGGDRQVRIRLDIDKSGKRIQLNGDPLPGDLQNIACSDLKG